MSDPADGSPGASGERVVDPERLRAFCVACFTSVDVPLADATIVADTLIEANLRGVDSHGVRHLPGYVHAVMAGMVNPHPDVRVERDSPAVAVWDGDAGFGQVACARAMDEAVARAKAHAFGAVSIRNSTHNGMVAYYPMMAARHGCIGFTTSSGAGSTPPFGSVTPLLRGVFSYAIPTGGDPIVLDTICTTVRPSKLRELAESGARVPAGWAIDRDGRPTEDPREALDGFGQWIGGHRGYGISVVMEVFAGVLSGGLFGNDKPVSASIGRPTPNVAAFNAEREDHFVSALHVEAFMPRDTFEAHAGRFVADIRACEPAAGVDAVLTPGEPESRTRDQRSAAGIPIPPVVRDELRALHDELGRVPPWFE